MTRHYFVTVARMHDGHPDTWLMQGPLGERSDIDRRAHEGLQDCGTIEQVEIWLRAENAATIARGTSTSRIAHTRIELTRVPDVWIIWIEYQDVQPIPDQG